MLWSVSDNLKQVRKDKERRGMEGATVKAEREILRKQWSDSLSKEAERISLF